MSPEQIDTALKIADHFVDVLHGALIAFGFIGGVFAGAYAVSRFRWK